MENTITLSWADEGHSILLMDFPELWNTNEFVDAVIQGYDFIEAAGRDMGTVMDFTRTQKLPRDMITHFTETGRHIHPNNHIIVLVLTSSYMEQLARIFSRVIRHLRLAPTRDEAISLIAAFFDSREA